MRFTYKICMFKSKTLKTSPGAAAPDPAGAAPPIPRGSDGRPAATGVIEPPQGNLTSRSISLNLRMDQLDPGHHWIDLIVYMLMDVWITWIHEDEDD